LSRFSVGGTGTHSPDVPEVRKKGERGVVWYERGLECVPTPVFDGTTCRPGASMAGPAIVEFPETTLVLWPGDRATVNAAGSLSIEV
jgi:N-methylhydantoinase A